MRKKDAFKKVLDRNVPKQTKLRKREYKEYKRRAKQMIEESKKRVDEEFGRQLSEKYSIQYGGQRFILEGSEK